MVANKLLFVLLFALLPLCSATTLDINPYYSAGELVTISGECDSSGVDVGVQLVSSYETLYIDQLESAPGFSTTYRLPASASGTYTIYATCTGETAVSKSFTIGTAPASSYTGSDDSGGQFVEEGPECDNKMDDDGDGLVDYPADPGCSSPEDDSEYNAVQTQMQTPKKETKKASRLPSLTPVCGDGKCSIFEDEDAYPEDCFEEDDDEEGGGVSFIWLVVIIGIGGLVFWAYYKGYFTRYSATMNDKFAESRVAPTVSGAAEKLKSVLPSNRLKRYVDKERAKGFSDSQIKKTLLTAGWKPQQVDDAFNS